MRKKHNRILLAIVLVLVFVCGSSSLMTVSAAGTPKKVTAKETITNGKWVKTKKGLRFRRKNGSYVKKCWYRIGKEEYYFDRFGYLVKKNWVGNRYVDKNGKCIRNSTIEGRSVNKEGMVNKLSSKDRYIIVGASRIVEMSIAVHSKDTVFIAKGGEGLKWMKRVAEPQLASYLKQKPNCRVIIQLGNNDMKNKAGYMSYFRQLMERYPSTKFYYLDITPCDGKLKQGNGARKQFNADMKAVFGTRCIGGYDYLMKTGFSTVDGMHYPAKVSKKLYNYVISKVKKL